MSRIVLWSGGADSTYLLERVARQAGPPIRAISIINHPYILPKQLNLQYECQKRYLALPHVQEYNIQHETISIDGKFKFQGDFNNSLGQPLVFLCFIVPLIEDGDVLCTGWVPWDGIRKIENIRKFENAFNSLMTMKGITADYMYTLSDIEKKSDILKKLKEYNIPDNCWWYCEQPYNNKACKHCRKCQEIKEK